MSAAVRDVQRRNRSIPFDLAVAGAVPVVRWRMENVLEDLQCLLPPQPGRTTAMRVALNRRQPKSSAAVLQHSHRALQSSVACSQSERSWQRLNVLTIGKHASFLAKRSWCTLGALLDCQYQRVAALLSPPEIDVGTWVASKPTLSDDVKDAAAITSYINNHIPLHACAVCGVY